MSKIPALGSLRQKDWGVQERLGYIVEPSLKIHEGKKSKGGGEEG